MHNTHFQTNDPSPAKSRRDCVARAIAIATEQSYYQVVQDLLPYCNKERLGKRKKDKSHPHKGVYNATYSRYLQDLGWIWHPTMHVGSGCKVHLRASELPPGRLVVRLSKHLTAVIDGVIHDRYDCSRNGTRCVYGYWAKEPVMAPTYHALESMLSLR